MRHILPIASLCPAALTATALAQVATVLTSEDTILPDSRTVFIKSANIPGDGLVIIFATRNGKIDPAPLGQISLQAGDAKNVRVKLTREAQPGSLVVSLYVDYGGKGVYDNDPAVLDVDIPEAVVTKARLQRTTR